MKQFTREPTRMERAFAIALSALLACVLGAVAMFLAWKGVWIAAAVVGALFACVVLLLCRAIFGRRRALGRKGSYRLAWVLLLQGIGGFALAALADPGDIKRLMVLGGSTTMVSAGIAGIQGRRSRD